MSFEVNSSNLSEIMDTDKLVVLDFWASWCEPCKAMLPIFEEVSNELGNKVVMGKVKVDDNRDVTRKYRIMSVPSFVFIKNKEVVEFLPMAIDKDTLLNKIKSHI